ncbi:MULTISPECIES: hypothetical protein [unclassified Sphingobium]|uniref:hypothetical protein n=1 Tax=unclassified Sphingobium TaxID=2611147 RepID=UPI0035A66265
MSNLEPRAPTQKKVVDYDQQHLALYAELISADDAGRSWIRVAHETMGLDVSNPDAEACWASHLERARWIIGDGLEAAILAFGRRLLS